MLITDGERLRRYKTEAFCREYAISKNFAFLAWVSYLWPSIPSKIGIRSTVLVGSSVLVSLAIFRIILDIAFSFVDELLNGGGIYEFFPDNDWVKISNKAPNDVSLLYPEIHVLKRFEWCRESDIPSTSRWRCLCSISRRPWGVDQQLRSWHDNVYLRTYSRTAWYSREPFFSGLVKIYAYYPGWLSNNRRLVVGFCFLWVLVWDGTYVPGWMIRLRLWPTPF